MKFGGSSMGSAEMIMKVGQIIKNKVENGYFPIIVCSAMGKTTNNLISAGEKVANKYPSQRQISVSPSGRDAASYVQSFLQDVCKIHLDALDSLKCENSLRDEIENLLLDAGSILNGVRLVRELSTRTRDLLMSFGERMSVRILASYLRQIGLKASARDAWDVGMITSNGNGSADSDVGTAVLLPDTPKRINENLQYFVSHAQRPDSNSNVLQVPHSQFQNSIQANVPLPLKKSEIESYAEILSIPVITGFISMDEGGIVTTLGRGGSDLTAAVIGSSIRAAEVEIWTDVNGILTADPRVVPTARHIPVVSFREASEFAYFGAKVLHPLTIRPAVVAGIPVRVLNTFNPCHEGTIIRQDEMLDVISVSRVDSFKHLAALSEQDEHSPDEDEEQFYLNSSKTSPFSPSYTTSQSSYSSQTQPQTQILQSQAAATLQMWSSHYNFVGDRNRCVKKILSCNLVKAVTCKFGVTLIDISTSTMLGNHGFLAKVFSIFDKLSLSVDVVATSEISLSLTLDKGSSKDQMQRAVEELRKVANVDVETDKSIVTLLCNTYHSSEIIANACAVFAYHQTRVDMVSFGASRVNISFVLDGKVPDDIVRSLHEVLIEQKGLLVPTQRMKSLSRLQQEQTVSSHQNLIEKNERLSTSTTNISSIPSIPPYNQVSLVLSPESPTE